MWLERSQARPHRWLHRQRKSEGYAGATDEERAALRGRLRQATGRNHRAILGEGGTVADESGMGNERMTDTRHRDPFRTDVYRCNGKWWFRDDTGTTREFNTESEARTAHEETMPTPVATDNQNAFAGLFAIVNELLEAVEWLARDGADSDDCAKARPHVEKARALIDAVKAVAAKHDAEAAK